MKYIFSIIILLITVKSYSQIENPYTHLKIDNGQLIYENIFIKDSLKGIEIETLLTQQLPTAKGITNIKSANGVITCNFINLFISWDKYEANNMSSVTNAPMSGNINILIKDNKYKVTVNTIVFSITSPVLGINQIITTATSIENILMKNGQTEYRTRGDLVRIGKAIEQQFNDIFTLKPIHTDW